LSGDADVEVAIGAEDGAVEAAQKEVPAVRGASHLSSRRARENVTWKLQLCSEPGASAPGGRPVADAPGSEQQNLCMAPYAATPTARRRAAALSVCSQVNAGSSRPK